MTCTIRNGYQLPCRDVGGIQDIWIANWYSDFEVNVNSEGVVFDMTPTQFFLFELMLETGFVNEELQSSIENGSTYWEQTLTVNFYKIQQELINKIETLSQGRWIIIIKDNNGVFRLLGQYNPVYVSSANIQSGKLMSELNGAEVTFTSLSRNPMPTIDEDFAMSLLYPGELSFRTILDPRNYMDSSDVVSDGVFNVKVAKQFNYISYYGTDGIPFPYYNANYYQTLENLGSPDNEIVFSNLDETGPELFNEQLVWDTPPPANKAIMVWSKFIPGSNTVVSDGRIFEDSMGFQASNSPLVFFAPDGTRLATVNSNIDITMLSTSNGTATLRLDQSFSPIDGQIPPGYESYLTGLFEAYGEWQKSDFPLTPDPDYPTRAYAVNITPGIYTFSLKVKIKDSPELPFAYSDIIIELY